MINESTEGPYRTSDLYFAAFLKVALVPFQGTVKEGPRVYFLFENVAGMRDLRDQFFNKTAKIVARDYADEIRTMKTLLHMDG